MEGNQRMWQGHWGRIAPGDLIVLPKLPKDRHWKIVRVTGDYYFDLREELGDYGHVLPVEQVVADVSNRNRLAGSGLQRTMRTRSRLWNIDGLAAEVDRLVDHAGEDVSRTDTDIERLEDVLQEAVGFVREQLASRFRGNQNERPVARLLERLYGETAVQTVAGPAEAGADYLITTVDPLGLTFTTVVQLKSYEGRIGDWDHGALDQVRLAVDAYDADAAVILTTADGETDDFARAREALAAQLGVQVRLVAG
jgi:predicted Mrr-cat superfamily restriction endonuclease